MFDYEDDERRATKKWTDMLPKANQTYVLEMTEDKSYGKRSLAEQLREKAAQEFRMARQYEGCTWMGNEHPSAPHRRKAHLLEMAARQLELANT